MRFVVSFLFLSLLGIAGYFGYVYFRSEQFDHFMRDLGLGRPVRVSVSGTGSMYPTFPKGKGKTVYERLEEVVATPRMYLFPSGFRIGSTYYYSTEIGFGDIVSFENDRTKKIYSDSAGLERPFLKRVIGLPGDTIELRGGIVYRNGVGLREPYIARAQSTFGGSFLPECQVVTVPAQSLFVLGDNRKSSNDSRFDIGFISFDDVRLFIPFYKQKGVLDSQWHDADDDLLPSRKISLDISSFVTKINEARLASGLQPYRLENKLNLSAAKRGSVMLSFEDFSFEATRSGYTARVAMQDAGYSNILVGELPVQGYYESHELYDYIFEFPSSRNFFLDPEFTDIGVGVVEGLLRNCPTQIIVIHLAGYRPPNYSEEQIESFRKGLALIRESRASWFEAFRYTDYYLQHKDSLDRMIVLFNERIRYYEAILQQMEANKYLTDDQELFLKKRNEEIVREQEAIADRLNN